MTKNKPKVSTKYRKARLKEERILNLLRSNPEGLFVKIIAINLGLNYESTKSIMRRLWRRGVVRLKENIRGCYVLVEDKTHAPILHNFHNLVLVYQLEKGSIDRSVFEKIQNGATTIYFRIGKTTQKISMQVASSLTFDISTLQVFGILFQQIALRYVNILPSFDEIWVTTIELNKDQQYARFEGISAITVGNTIAELKLYDKKKFSREEVKTRIPFTVQTMRDILDGLIMFSEFNSRLNGMDSRLFKVEKIMKDNVTKTNSFIKSKVWTKGEW